MKPDEAFYTVTVEYVSTIGPNTEMNVLEEELGTVLVRLSMLVVRREVILHKIERKLWREYPN